MTPSSTEMADLMHRMRLNRQAARQAAEAPSENNSAPTINVPAALLESLQHDMAKLRAELDVLCAPEHHPVTILEVDVGGHVLVKGPGVPQILVDVHPSVPREHLAIGRRGVLAKAKNCLLQVLPQDSAWRDTGTYEGPCAESGGIWLRNQEQLMAVPVSANLSTEELTHGDLVGFDREGSGLAMARVKPPSRRELFLKERPNDRFSDLGGLDDIIGKLRRIVGFAQDHAETARRYRLPPKRGVLLEGPPGNGKTKLARCLAGEFDMPFILLSGSTVYSPWLGQAEATLEGAFTAAREEERCLLYIDEIDAIARRRGSDLSSGAPDRILNTFLSLLDGVCQVPGLIVLASTNLPQLLDGGLTRPGRMDYKLHVGAPRRAGAVAILTAYLSRELPLAPELAQAGLPMVIEQLASRIYSPNGQHAELARVVLRDGRRVNVQGRDLVSGALLENVVSRSLEEAAWREADTGEVGLRTDDLLTALAEEMAAAARLLSPGNARSYLRRLPRDVDAVEIELLP